MTHAPGRPALGRRRAGCPPGGRIVEIGSFRGRSMIVLARAAPDGRARSSPSTPTPATTGARRRSTASPTTAADWTTRCSTATSSRPACATGCTHVRAFSSDAHDDVDGADRPALHRRRPPLRPRPRRHPRVGRPGRPRRHDADPRLVQLDRRHPRHRAGAAGQRSVALRGPVGVAHRVPPRARSAARPASRNARRSRRSQLPWFARNVLIKVLITARLGRVTRALRARPVGPGPTEPDRARATDARLHAR